MVQDFENDQTYPSFKGGIHVDSSQERVRRIIARRQPVVITPRQFWLVGVQQVLHRKIARFLCNPIPT
jgi:hypothetical protein